MARKESLNEKKAKLLEYLKGTHIRESMLDKLEKDFIQQLFQEMEASVSKEELAGSIRDALLIERVLIHTEFHEKHMKKEIDPSLYSKLANYIDGIQKAWKTADQETKNKLMKQFLLFNEAHQFSSRFSFYNGEELDEVLQNLWMK